MLLIGVLSIGLVFTTALDSTPTAIPPLNQCALECYINVSFATEKNSTQLVNEIKEILSIEFKNISKNYLFLEFVKLSAQADYSVTYWFNLLFQRPYCDGILKQEVLTKSQYFFPKPKWCYIILRNSLQIKPFEIPPSRNKLLSMELKLKGNFTKELKNISSEEYKTLEYKMIRNLSFLMENVQGFVKVIINGFEDGSIVVKAQLLFDSDKVKVTDDEIKKDTEIKMIRYLEQLNDTIDEYEVDINSFKIDEKHVVPEESSNVPAWAIIVFLILLIPLIIIWFIQKIKIKKLKTALQSFITNQITDELSQINSNGSCGKKA